jgi:hypothetical protein
MIANTLPMDFIAIEFTFIVATIQKLEDTFTSLGTILVLSLVALTIEPLLDSDSVLLVILPLPYVLGSI